MELKRVVVTGLGALTPVGNTVAENGIPDITNPSDTAITAFRAGNKETLIRSLREAAAELQSGIASRYTK